VKELQSRKFDPNDINALREDYSKIEREYKDLENELNTPYMSQIRGQLEFKYNPPINFNGRDVLGKLMKLFKIKD
jgi:hypothetical protein